MPAFACAAPTAWLDLLLSLLYYVAVDRTHGSIVPRVLTDDGALIGSIAVRALAAAANGERELAQANAVSRDECASGGAASVRGQASRQHNAAHGHGYMVSR